MKKQKNNNCVICKKKAKSLKMGLGMQTDSFCSKKCFRVYTLKIDPKGDNLAVDGTKIQVKKTLTSEQLIAEIGSLTVQLEELKDKNRHLENMIKMCTNKEENLKLVMDKYQKFREDLVQFITRY